MSERRTVWVVTKGEYSDYRLCAIYERQEDADACASRIGGDVDEYPLYSPGDDSYRLRPMFAEARIVHPDGRIDEHRRWTYETDGDQDPPDSGRVYLTPQGVYQVTAHATDRERARKVATERAAMVGAVLAEGGDPEQVRW